MRPGTSYEIRLKLEGKEVKTWAETLDEVFPVGKKTELTSGTDPITITESGEPGAYHLITSPEKTHTTIDVRNAADHTLIIDADYVIVRGIELKNAAIHGIMIQEGRHHIMIEYCHITFWARVGGPISYGNEGVYDSGIYARRGAGHLIIQRNLIETPRGCSNDWDTGHPSGPYAIRLINSSGGNIIRYNDLVTSLDHSYNDIIAEAVITATKDARTATPIFMEIYCAVRMTTQSKAKVPI